LRIDESNRHRRHVVNERESKCIFAQWIDIALGKDS
jgi:hypothetical protein